MIFFNESSSSDDNEEMEINLQLNQLVIPQRVPARIENFVERTIANSTNIEFQSHFRITRPAYQNLLQILGPLLSKEEGIGGKGRIDVEKQLLAAIWLLATPESYRSVGNRFNLSKSSLFECFVRVITALNQISPDFIQWPNREERRHIKQAFRQMANVDGVIGAVDGTYVPIKAPREHPEVYVNRKCFHGITLQAICVPSLRFIDCFTGYPSSVSDIRIFRNSDIYTHILENEENYFDENEFIIGDKAYPVINWCIPPFIERGQVPAAHIRFNIAHARTRQVIERAFALLFGRFRRLRYIDMNRVDLIPSTIIACCTLHNICLMQPDELVQVYIQEGVPVVNNDDNEGIDREAVRGNAGILRRNNLAAAF